MTKRKPFAPTSPHLRMAQSERANTRGVVTAKKPKKIKSHPNRIFELMKARGWTYADVAERIRKLAKDRNLSAYRKVHEVTINRLAIGKAKLTQDWMNMLGEIYSVPAHEIISAPVAQNLRRVGVICALIGGEWKPAPQLPEKEQFDIMIPNDEVLQDANLYAGEIRGPSYNLRYPDKSVVVLSTLEQKPGEITVGRRYHVRATRPDGTVEDTIKTLAADDSGRYWLKPESNHPAHQEWLALGGMDGIKVEIIGRVRGVFYRED